MKIFVSKPEVEEDVIICKATVIRDDHTFEGWAMVENRLPSESYLKAQEQAIYSALALSEFAKDRYEGYANKPFNL